jgi:hypothetical protein
MNTIRYVENGKVDESGRPVRVPEAVRSTQGLSLFNASGDIAEASLGFKYAIDTMSFIKSEITEQKFYTIPFADYIPTSVGRGSWADAIFTNVSFSNAGDFASGFINTGLNTRFAGVDAAVASKSQKIRTWAKQLTYSIAEVEQALQSNNWDPIMAKERARKENFDLGVQELSFIGVTGDTDITGLLNNGNVTIDTTTITKLISSMSAAELAAFVQTLIKSYFQGTVASGDVGTQMTAMPTHFAIPYSDWLGLSVPFPGSVGTYPLPMIDYLIDAFKRQTQNPGFTVYPVAYCDPSKSASGATEYCLYRKDPRSLCLEIPIGYTTTAANTLNNFTFQNVGYARVGGVGVFRNLETRYFHF